MPLLAGQLRVFAAKVHAGSDVWHLIRATAERDGSHRAFCGLRLDGPDDPWRGGTNGHVDASAVPMVDRCLRCARLGRWVEHEGSLF